MKKPATGRRPGRVSARLTAALSVMVLAAALIGFTTSQATAAGASGCVQRGADTICTVGAPGSPGGGVGGGGGGGGTRTCTWPDEPTKPLACTLAGYGWYSTAYPTRIHIACYFTLASPQPQPGPDSPWGTHKPGDGAIYSIHCIEDAYYPTVNIALEWFATPPGGAPQYTPEQLAKIAVADMKLQGAIIGSTPVSGPGGKPGLVGVPVWLWTDKTPHTWGPIEIHVQVPGLEVDAKAEATKIVWSMGDGNTVTCTQPGTHYVASDGVGESPDCGYTYTQDSLGQANGKYTITATTTFAIHWWTVGGGPYDDITTTATSTTTLQIKEVQVITSNPSGTS
jgi:hypothetical protein